MRTTTRLLATLAIAGLASSLSACAPQPGEYRIYKITYLGDVDQPDCGTEIDTRDSSTFFQAGTFTMFATDTDDYFIEYDGIVVTGTRDGKEYVFEGTSINVDDVIDGTTVTTTTQLTVEMTMNGRQIDGVGTAFASAVCSGTCDAFPDTQCTKVRKFFGTEVKGVELEHPI